MKEYQEKKWWSLTSLADNIAEFNKDGELDQTAWEFWEWLDKKSARVWNRHLKAPKKE